MPSASSALYRLPAARALLADEAEALRPELVGVSGDYGLVLSAHEADLLPATPMLGVWWRMRAEGARMHGDLLARADEPLPFQDDAFRVIVLSHVLEAVSHPNPLLDEVARVLAPGGLLAITGFHPLSAWSAWLWWRGRHEDSPSLAWPQHWWSRLARCGVDAYALRRVGRAWPVVSTRPVATVGLSGAFVLLARKQPAALTPLQLPAVRVRPAVPVGWAPGAHRECA